MRWRSLLVAALLLAASRDTRADDAAVRTQLAEQLDAELAVLAETRAIVDAKLADATALRRRRVRAAYGLLREPGERMTTARRRVAARWLLARDRVEQQLLADESASLAAAHARLVADRSFVALAPLPVAPLDPPADRFTIARRFGLYQHDRSKATLSRRGLDLDTKDGVDVHPVAAGTVLYAGPIRGLDDGVVIDHGGWLSVTAKLAPVALRRGDRIERGAVLGQPARRRIYLELRVAVGPGGIPIDPEPFLR